INAIVSMNEQATELTDSVSQILDDMALLHPTLSRTIRDYAAVIDAYANSEALPAVAKTAPDSWVASHTAGQTTSVISLAPGIKGVGLSVSVDSGVVLNFWLNVEDGANLTSATVNGTDVLSTLQDRGDGHYTVSFACGAADLRDLLTLQVNGSAATVSASPLSYAKKLALQEGCEDLGQATIEYAYYVSVLCGPEDESLAPAMTPLAPTGTVDTVHEDVRAYLARARSYYVPGVDSDSVRTDVDLGNMNVPVIFSFKNDSDAVLIEPLLEISEDPSFASLRSVVVTDDAREGDIYTISVDNLKTGITYYWRVSVLVNGGRRVNGDIRTFETAAGPRILTIDGVSNARDLGGWDTADGKTVRQGLIYRTGKLDKATAKGLDVLVNELMIKTELDFRNPDLAADQPMNSPFKDSPNYINIASKSYSISEQADKNARIMRVFADPSNYPIVFHCSAGADRTGAWAWMVKALCGVNDIDLVCDYELTNYRYRIGTDQYPFPKLYNWFMGLPGDTMQEKAFGYLRDECGMSEMELANIVTILTTDSAVFTKPSATALRANDGQISAAITLRSSQSVESVTAAGGAALPFSFADGVLTVTVSGTAESAGTITFDDGSTLPLVWTVS
ncbi:MAG: tyrosine-protein phosphatase, partial [Clostridia bacterium]|nr:tyrosine-protein phosphatase [Clostridia bacterium]